MIAKTIGFILSHWTTLSGMYSPHTVAAAAMVGGCDAKKEVRGKHMATYPFEMCNISGQISVLFPPCLSMVDLV